MAKVNVYEPPDDASSVPIEVELHPEGRRQVVRAADYRSLTERMFAKAPAEGYSIWIDLADPLFLYIAEAPDGSLPDAASFRGVRMPLTTGAEVLERVGFSWSSRATGWS